MSGITTGLEQVIHDQDYNICGNIAISKNDDTVKICPRVWLDELSNTDRSQDGRRGCFHIEGSFEFLQGGVRDCASQFDAYTDDYTVTSSASAQVTIGGWKQWQGWHPGEVKPNLIQRSDHRRFFCNDGWTKKNEEEYVCSSSWGYIFGKPL